MAIVTAVSTCHPTPAEQAQATNSPTTLGVSSAIDQVRIVHTNRLPPNPKRAAIDDACASYGVAKPKTLGGQLAARNGWIVTSETKLGRYDTVTFVGGLDPSTSSTCAHLDGNLAVFDGRNLKALAYMRAQSAPSLVVDVAAEDSLGSAEQVNPRRIRLTYGLPSSPFADVVLGEGISIEQVATKDPVCGGAAMVPNVFSEDIRTARKKLIAYGWLPKKPAEEPSGGPFLFPPGVAEVEDCSGTGYGFCAFNYRHKKGFGLRVISMGEEFSVVGYSPYCSGSWKDRFGQ